MTRLPVLVLAALGLTLAACGDDSGGGDEEAFCEALETLSEQVADGDLASNDGLEDVVDTMNELIESAPDDDVETVEDIAETVAEADDDDAEDTADEIQDELGDFAEDCDIDDDEFAVFEAPTTTTTTEAEPTSTTEDTETTLPPVSGDDLLVSARQPVPADIAPEYAALAEACFAGDMVACDELYGTTPVGSADEEYGETCGGRLAEADPGQCSTTITGPQPVPADVVDQTTAAACEAGDMVACDDLFRAAPVGSVDEEYGALCAGRVPDTDAFCVDIFGDVAFL